ncbi:MAG: class I SAM-dependent methyltransferase [Phycisphaerae bacterium]|nr:class I SAM-dependent methyltransferase [Phycisphaerae bacterium]
MLEEATRWETAEGPRFLREVGLREGDTVLDFGAWVGRYALPAARVVGPRGVVHAVDKDSRALDELEAKAAQVGLTNIRCVRASDDTHWDVEKGTVDICMCYDILHLLPRAQRAQVYGEFRRLLKGHGWLSVYPAHVAGVEPADPNYFKSLTTGAVLEEIEGAGFVLDRKVCGSLIHEERLVRGCVFNLRNSPPGNKGVQ